MSFWFAKKLHILIAFRTVTKKSVDTGEKRFFDMWSRLFASGSTIRMTELFATINVHLLIVNAITLFVAPIVHVPSLFVELNLFQFTKPPKSLKTKRRFSAQISYTKLFACNYADGSCAALHAVFTKNIDWLISLASWNQFRDDSACFHQMNCYFVITPTLHHIEILN